MGIEIENVRNLFRKDNNLIILFFLIYFGHYYKKKIKGNQGLSAPIIVFQSSTDFPTHNSDCIIGN